jgi:hypothetical protein
MLILLTAMTGTCTFYEIFRSKDVQERKNVESIKPPLWSSGQSSWLQIQRPVFDSRHYQIRSRTQTMKFVFFVVCRIYK